MDKPTVFLLTDIETTGLDPADGEILEIGMQTLDVDLEPIDDGLYQTLRHFKPVDEYIQAMHGANGLLDESETSGIDPAVAFARARDYVAEYAARARVLPAGSSVDFDRRWLTHHAPGMFDGCHHRVMDVSVLHEAAAAWNPALSEIEPRLETDHRVRTCMANSLVWLRWWRDRIGRLVADA